MDPTQQLLALVLQMLSSGKSGGPSSGNALTALLSGGKATSPTSTLGGLLNEGSPTVQYPDLATTELTNAGEVGTGALTGFELDGPIGAAIGAGVGDVAVDIQGFKQSTNQGLLDTFLGPFVGPALAGRPRTETTTDITKALGTSGNPDELALADFIQNQVLGKGKVLSDPAGANTPEMANVIEWLTGQPLPGLTASGGSNKENTGNGTIYGVQNLAELDKMLGQGPGINSNELLSNLPQIENIVGSSGNLKDVTGQIMGLLNRPGASRSAGGGNALSLISSLFGGSSSGAFSMEKIQEILRQLQTGGGMNLGGGASGGLVGATA